MLNLGTVTPPEEKAAPRKPTLEADLPKVRQQNAVALLRPRNSRLLGCRLRTAGSVSHIRKSAHLAQYLQRPPMKQIRRPQNKLSSKREAPSCYAANSIKQLLQM